MEFLAFQNCMGFLSACEVVMSTFISDRHGAITKYMKTKLNSVKHYFDLWHLKKSKCQWYSKIMSRHCLHMMRSD